MHIMRGSVDLDSAAVRRQILLRVFPIGISERGAECCIGADQKRWRGHVGKVGKEFTCLTSLGEDTYHCFAGHVL